MVDGAGDSQNLFKVTDLEVKGENVRLGFEGEAAVPVHRWEA